MTIRAVRRSKRSGSKVYVLIGSSEFLLTVLPHFQANNSSGPLSKYVLVAEDNWNSNFSEGIYIFSCLIYNTVQSSFADRRSGAERPRGSNYSSSKSANRR